MARSRSEFAYSEMEGAVKELKRLGTQLNRQLKEHRSGKLPNLYETVKEIDQKVLTLKANVREL